MAHPITDRAYGGAWPEEDPSINALNKVPKGKAVQKFQISSVQRRLVTDQDRSISNNNSFVIGPPYAEQLSTSSTFHQRSCGK
jgi:hypothetical protein